MKEFMIQLWKTVSNQLATIAVFLMMIVLMQSHVQLLIAEELRISLSLAERVVSFTGGIYLGVYLFGELARALVMTRQYQDAVAIGALFVGVLVDSLVVALGLLLAVNIVVAIHEFYQKSERAQALWGKHKNSVENTLMYVFVTALGAVLVWLGLLLS